MDLKSKAIFLMYVFGAIMALAMVVLQARAQEPAASPDIEALAEQLELFVMPRSGPYRPDQITIAQQAMISAWARSAHADSRSESFAHWNAEGAIPPACAVCHAGAGFRSFHGLDGSTPGLPAAPMPTGGVVDCATCHDPNLGRVTEIRMPSGVMHPVATTAETACLTCHQGRASGVQVAEATGAEAADTPDPALGFINPHYAVAGAVWLGGYAQGGYHYPGRVYSGRFFHARPVNTCVSCHEPHSLEVAEETCRTCHETGTPADIRIARQSYDGSGNLGQGIRADIAANAARLMAVMRDYAAGVAGTALLYDGARYPYFFADANGDGQPDMAEGRAVAFNAWTPRLLRAAYNWKFVTADPGAYAHNPHYALELLYDSIEDLALAAGQDFAAWNLSR